jgi:hypothetical protein
MQVNGAPVQALTEAQKGQFRTLIRELHDEPHDTDIFPVDPLIEGETYTIGENGSRTRIDRKGRNKFIYDLIANARILDTPGHTLDDELRRCIVDNPAVIMINDIVRSKARDIFDFVKDVVGPIIAALPRGTPLRLFKQSLWTMINAIFPVNVVGGRRKSRGGCGCMVPQTGGYRATKKDKKYLKMYKQGKSIGFTMTASLKAKGLIPRANGTRKVSNKYKRA